jgi:uncharacterized protein GlcG (DUF336 family)
MSAPLAQSVPEVRIDPCKHMFRERRFWIILLGGLLATGLAHGQTSQVQTLSLYGARAVLHAAEQKAQQLSAPSSLAVVDAAGDLILFEQMQGARPIGIELAIGKARSAARYQEATQTLEATINTGRPAAITSEMVQDGWRPADSCRWYSSRGRRRQRFGQGQ